MTLTSISTMRWIPKLSINMNWIHVLVNSILLIPWDYQQDPINVYALSIDTMNIPLHQFLYLVAHCVRCTWTSWHSLNVLASLGPFDVGELRKYQSFGCLWGICFFGFLFCKCWEFSVIMFDVYEDRQQCSRDWS